jgi:hypothetical protein
MTEAKLSGQMEAAGWESLHSRPRCMDCGELIGVYEPLMHVIDDIPRRTSRAAEPDVGRSAGDCYHAGCYEQIAWGG